LGHIIIRLLKREKGATAIEYAMIASLVAIGIATACTSMGSTLNGIFTSVSNAL